jgi:hypothetical protein
MRERFPNLQLDPTNNLDVGIKKYALDGQNHVWYRITITNAVPESW